MRGFRLALAALLLPTATALALSACGDQSSIAQIKAVIEKADHEQEDAVAAHDVSIMADTNTARNFAIMVQDNQEFAQQGVVGIRLMKLEWGPINITSPDTATAVNWETWEQTDANGNTISAREHEIFKLIKVGQSWKIDQITYPDQQQPSASRAGTPSPTPAPS